MTSLLFKHKVPRGLLTGDKEYLVATSKLSKEQINAV